MRKRKVVTELDLDFRGASQNLTPSRSQQRVVLLLDSRWTVEKHPCDRGKRR